MIDWTFGISALIATSIGIIYKGQQFLVYMPNYPKESRTLVEKPPRYGMENYEDIELVCSDGIKIKAYLIKRKENTWYHKYNDNNNNEQQNQLKEENEEGGLRNRNTSGIGSFTIIYFHANAGNLGHRLPIASQLYKLLNCNILMVSYRGYGKSLGEPSEEGLKLDAQAALDFILSHPILKNNKIILYGQSIGGAVAINLAYRNSNSIHGLIIENTFLSLSKLVNTLLPVSLGSCLSFLLNQNWDSESIISHLNHLPILFISGSNDQLVHPSHMIQLFELASKDSSATKQFINIPEGTHNDTCTFQIYYQAILEFLIRNGF